MPRTRIKICGVRDIDTARAAADAGADAVGLVFAEGSPRLVTPAQAREIVDELPAFVEPVGLFVNAAAEHIRRVCGEAGLRTIQLHGDESAQFAAGLAPLRVIKAFAFRGNNVSEMLAPWSGPRNFAGMLWDTPPTAKDSQPGGSGRAFAWTDLAELKLAGSLPAWAPLIVAGGLTPDNVAEAIALLSPYAVDVSSGVESSRGVKDIQKIHAFCEAVRGIDRQRGE